MIAKLLLGVVILSLSLNTQVFAENVSLSVAASMTDAFKELMARFAKDHPSVQFRPNFAGSGALAKQIEQGAPADIYVSANPKWMDYLVAKKLIASGTDQVLTYNKLVFIGTGQGDVFIMADLVKLKRIALGSPQSVPAGQYARQAMEAAGIYQTLVESKKLVMAKDVRQALLYADRGEVDGAFVYQTDALLAKDAVILFTVADNLYDQVSCPIALTVSGAANDSARMFYDYVVGPQVAAVFTKYGFESVR